MLIPSNLKLIFNRYGVITSYHKTQKLMEIRPSVRFLDALRNTGYHNYNAIPEFIDNSLDAGAEKIQIHIDNLDYDGKIIIGDDGCGMTKETLIQALQLGSETEHDPTLDLGYYGTGINSASLSIGKQLKCITKHADGEIEVLIFDFDHIKEKRFFDYPDPAPTKEDIKLLNKYLHPKTKTGTVLILSKLDQIKERNVEKFVNTLSSELALVYKYFLDEKGIKLSINDKLLSGFDPMHRNEHWSRKLNAGDDEISSFEFEGKHYKFNAYHIENSGLNDSVSGKRAESIARQRSLKNSGLYIYRNYRLVGRALDLGAVDKHPKTNGFRVELFVDGEDDHLFGSTFQKIITERDKKDCHQGFIDKLQATIYKYRQSSYHEDYKQVTPDEALKKDMNEVFEEINRNKLIGHKSERIKEPQHEPEPVLAEGEGQVVTFLTKGVKTNGAKEKATTSRKAVKKYDWEMEALGEADQINYFKYEKGKIVIVWNTSHKFWKHFMQDANRKVKSIINSYFIAEALALESVGNVEIQDKIRFEELYRDEFSIERSAQLRKALTP